MKTVRQAVLEYIRTHTQATVEELSRVMQVTPANIRHHLAILKGQGLVEAAGQRPPSGKGRPRRFYRLTSLAAGDNLACLTNAVLNEYLGGLTTEQRQRTLRQVAHAMLAGSTNAGDWESTRVANLTRRLNNLVRLLNEWHYQARWEARLDAPHLILSRCPYGQIIAQQPVLCQLDQYIFEEALGRRVELSEKLAEDERGVPACLLVIHSA